MERDIVLDQFETSTNSLTGYDWSKVMSSLKEKDPRFAVGRALFKDDHSEVRPHSEIVEKIENGLKNKGLVLLVSAKRMGTTTIGKEWVDKKPNEREIEDATLWDQDDYENDLDEVPEKEVFVDEFTGAKDEMFDLVDTLVKKQDRKLILRVFSHVAEKVEKKIEEKGLDFEEVKLLPLPKDKMREYVGSRLSLESNDPLVVVTTDMAGGSLLIAHSICSNLTSHAKWSSEEMNLQEFKKVLVGSYKEICKVVMSDWMRDKKETSEKFKNTYPSPLLQGLDPNIVL